MTEPRTEAGRRLLASSVLITPSQRRAAILAIEVEAAAGPRDEGLWDVLLSAAEEAHIFGPDHDRRPIFECSYEPCRQRRTVLAKASE